jgi:hypothetical protein
VPSFRFIKKEDLILAHYNIQTKPSDNMLKIKGVACLLILAIAYSSILICASAEAKPTLNLDYYKNNGYGMGNDMNGEWTLNTQVSKDVQRVEFFLDNQLQLNDSSAPFSWQFNTGNYSESLHTIKVVAIDSSGEQAIVEDQRNFVGFPLTFVEAIIGIVIAVTIVSFIVALYLARRKEAKEKMKTANSR